MHKLMVILITLLWWIADHHEVERSRYDSYYV